MNLSGSDLLLILRSPASLGSSPLCKTQVPRYCFQYVILSTKKWGYSIPVAELVPNTISVVALAGVYTSSSRILIATGADRSLHPSFWQPYLSNSTTPHNLRTLGIAPLIVKEGPQKSFRSNFFERNVRRDEFLELVSIVSHHTPLETYTESAGPRKS